MFFFETAARFDHAALVGKQTILHADDEHQRKFETLGRVQCHQLHTIIPGLALRLAGLQRRMAQE